MNEVASTGQSRLTVWLSGGRGEPTYEMEPSISLNIANLGARAQTSAARYVGYTFCLKRRTFPNSLDLSSSRLELNWFMLNRRLASDDSEAQWN
jgi:hypothetical protein